jgi:inorganic triphosphatase YgiF
VLEIELELKAGDPATLFAVGREVDAVATTRLSAISKAERGYRLLDSLPARYKAEPIVLAAGITIGEAFPAIVGSCCANTC